MFYLLLSLLLILTGGGLYLTARLKNQELPRSSKIMFAIFVVLGLLMSSFALQEISHDQYENLQKIQKEFPEIQTIIDAKGSFIQMYEYLEILEAYKAYKKEEARL